MTSSNIRRRAFASPLLAFAALVIPAAQSALGALPPVLDRVPADALGVIAAQSLERVDKGARDLLGAIEMPAMSTPAQVLAVMGLGDGLDMTRSAAIAVVPAAPAPDAAVDAPPYHFLAFVPTTDFAALLASFQPKPAAAGVQAIQVNGQSVFAKAIGDGYALLGDAEAVVADFQGAGGNLAAHKAAMGDVGARVADASDLFLVLTPAAMQTLAEQIMTQAQGQMQMAAMMAGGDAQKMQQGMQAAQAFVTNVVGQASATIVGVRAGALGARFDFAVNFRAGTDAANAFQIRGDSNRLLRQAPDQPFLFAAAGDYSSPAIKDLFHKATAVAGGGAPAEAAAAVDAADGQALAVYTTPGGLLTGLFANAVEFTATKDPAALIASTKQLLEGMGQQADALFAGAFTENALEVAGVKVDQWSLTMRAPAGGFGPQQQIVGALFGQMGISGYMAPVKGGVVRTIAKDAATLEKAIALINNGAGPSLAQNALIAGVASQLPDGRTAEGYVNVGELLRQALVMAATFIGQVNLDAPANLPPVGLSVTTDAGGARCTMFAPAPVIQTVVKVAQVVKQMQAGGDNGGKPPF